MAVMSTGVHDTWILTAERKSGVFINGKCIDICTKSDCLTVRGRFCLPRSLPRDRYNPDNSEESVPFPPEVFRFARWFFFLKRKLRMCMKITPLFDDPVFVLFCHILKFMLIFPSCKYIFWIIIWKSKTLICNTSPWDAMINTRSMTGKFTRNTI